ncbi:MAG: hypothetical protein HW421_1044 [Ignavibacteria bacterium]|nr:hypothetical protein [Ignavibacteria bacterium]
MKIRFFSIYILLAIFLVSGCKTGKPACITQKNENLKIRWGMHNYKTNDIRGYMLNTNSELFMIYKDSLSTGYSDSLIGKFDPEEFCKILRVFEKNIMKIQTLNEPAEFSRFIEYDNPVENMFVRAVWNSKFKTVSSEGFRRLYDSLEARLPQNKKR